MPRKRSRSPKAAAATSGFNEAEAEMPRKPGFDELAIAAPDGGFNEAEAEMPRKQVGHVLRRGNAGASMRPRQKCPGNSHWNSRGARLPPSLQ